MDGIASPAVEAENLTKHYGDVRALDGVSLKTAPGEIFGLLGHNGAGKSTMIRILTWRAKPTSGRARVLGTRCHATSRRSAADKPRRAGRSWLSRMLNDPRVLGLPAMRLRSVGAILLKDLRDAGRDGRILVLLLLPIGLAVFYNAVIGDKNELPKTKVAIVDPGNRGVAQQLRQSVVALVPDALTRASGREPPVQSTVCRSEAYDVATSARSPC
jgi:energy-coupling factor transporter ATP-binding protein EcfA2